VAVPRPAAAQEASDGAPEGGQASAAAAQEAAPLAHFVSRDNLILYIECAGLESRAEAWKKTAAYRMLTTTSLGSMLEEVGAQLFDHMLSSVPNRTFTGAEAVTLAKAAARDGFVLALNANRKGANPFVGTFVLRGGATKELKPVSSHLLGMMMGPEAKPRIERKAGRVMVIVPGGATPDGGWVWWPEKEDLVVGFSSPADADAIVDALDGKTPTAAEHPVITRLAKPEGTFTPVLTAFFDAENMPATAGSPRPQMLEFLEKARDSTGVKRLEYRWGCDDDALMAVASLAAPSPRKPLLGLFDQPPLDASKLIAMPEGVDSFVALSVAPAKLIEAVSQLDPSGQLKAKLDEAIEKVKSTARVDVAKDLLGNIGPKVVLYQAPGRSAVATDETTPPPSISGFDPMALLSMLTTNLPKPTMVAEVRDPASFAKALDATVIAINKEFKAQAIEKALEEEKNKENQAPGQGRAPGNERTSRRRSTRETPAPEFRMMPGTQGNSRTYMMVVPSESPLKPLPAGLHPTIRLDGKYLALSTASDAARTAIETATKQGGKLPGDLEKSLSRVPRDSKVIALSDPRETMPSLLASLPGTLQTRINTVIALSNSAASGAARPGAPAGQPAGGAPPGGASGGSMASYAAMRQGMSGDPRAAASGQPPAAGNPGSPATQQAMIELKVDPARLPKAEELKALLFPGTLAVTSDDQTIQIISREAFPNLVGSGESNAIVTSLMMPAIQAQARARAQAAASQAGQGGDAGATPPGRPNQPPAAAGGGLQPPSPGTPPAAPGRGGPGRRRRAEPN
jgi:hypothetical protein